ncbi:MULTISPECIES: hypothetical protein [Bacillus]|uniref:hypothetical protein n=1 Tax=Bacillus TaxID=1386 RepID=UPI00030CF59E|nr:MULTISPECIES: hypothetical protein [Bacillus]
MERNNQSLSNQEHNETNKYKEETAAEIATPYTVRNEEAYQTARKMTIAAKAIGYIGLLIAVLSLFFYPYVLGVIAIVLGFIALRKGEITFGSWAIGISAFSIILKLFVVPLF